MENSSLSEKNITLDELNEEEVERLIPLIVYLSVICICGAFGNSLVCYIYKTKYGPSNCRSFVICLSTIDLFSCVIVIPFEIAVIFKEYKFTIEILCQISVFLNTWPTLSSGLMLLAIAVDRYRKICKPFGWQISLKLARDICIFNIFLAIGFSWLSPIIYGVNETFNNSYNFTVSECTVKTSMKETIYPLINNIMFGMLFLGALISIFIMYCFIGHGVKRHSKKRMYHIKTRGSENSPLPDATDASELTIRSGNVVLETNKQFYESHDSDAMFVSETSDTKSVEDILQQEPAVPKERQIDQTPPADRNSVISFLEKTLKNRNTLFLTKSLNSLQSAALSKTSSSASGKARAATDRRQNSRQLKAHKTAYIMFLISLAFMISYFPLLVILLTRSINSKFVPELSDTERAAYKFVLRSYYLSCALNPVIYGVWDARFRKACRRILRKIGVC